jgi:hypothetical protein
MDVAVTPQVPGDQVNSLVKTESAELPPPAANSAMKPAPALLIPSLRGRMYLDDVTKKVVCRGMWAMTDAQHGDPNLTSEFEFNLVSALGTSEDTNNTNGLSGSSAHFPVNGKYQGWFKLKRSPPHKGTDKVDEKDISISFSPKLDSSSLNSTASTEGSGVSGTLTANGTTHSDSPKASAEALQSQSPRVEGSVVANGMMMDNNTPTNGTTTTISTTGAGVKEYIVSGEGSNKFGKFTLKGTLAIDSATGGNVVMYREYVPKFLKKVSTVGTNRIKRPASTDSNAPPTPREGAGRIRKQSAVIREFETSHQQTTQANKLTKEQRAAKNEMTKAQKLTIQLQKCLALIEDLLKEPQAMYFAVPVDPIALNIPDYSLVIKQPMDFSTIKKNLIDSTYAAPTEFAEHVRLVYKNAIQYNAMRDNPVHIAARAMSKLFEEKYKQIVNLFTSVAAAHSGGGSRAPAKKKIKSSHSNSSFGNHPALSRQSSSNSIQSRSSGPSSQYTGLPPDGSLIAMQQMQQKMAQMQSELFSLRTAVQKDTIRADLDTRQAHAQHPLSYDEKKSLISEIHNLGVASMTKVIEIIKQARPTAGGGDDEDIEIPLDELDTATLRKLQYYVASTKKGGMKGMMPVAQPQYYAAEEGYDLDLFPEL